MKTILLYLIPCLSVIPIFASEVSETQALCLTSQTQIRISSPYTPLEKNALHAFDYLLYEAGLDGSLTHEQRDEKTIKFKMLAKNISPGLDAILTSLLLDETRSRILEMLQNAGLDEFEINEHLEDYNEVILRAENMNVELARELLFFVAELKIHRQYVYDFGVALGCPEKQLLRHDLCKLHVEQFEAYARYFRGGRLEVDRPAYLAAWEIHQLEEHHIESYGKEGFSFDNFPEERLRNNMLESVADLQASTKQRGGSTLIDWLVNNFPKKNPHPRLLPYLEEGLKMAHAFYLNCEENPGSDNIFKGLPCWDNDVEEMFNKLKTNP
ncbi:MAG: hypothetical protein H0U49_07490 [Parachlamydiaceae bacterium]|nr:hypothetical protein [Parachlamydiaceae bacterium]